MAGYTQLSSGIFSKVVAKLKVEKRKINMEEIMTFTILRFSSSVKVKTLNSPSRGE